MSDIHAFRPGDHVEVVSDYQVDYASCFDDEELRGREYVYRIPVGSHGVVISRPSMIGTEYRQAVRFYDIPNWPTLYYSNARDNEPEHEIGPGHYVPINRLRLVEDGQTDFVSPGSIEDLF